MMMWRGSTFWRMRPSKADLLHQLYLRARDHSPEPREATTYVTINVERNLNDPQFDLPAGALRFVFDVYVTESVGTIISTIPAFDEDPTEPNNVFRFYETNPNQYVTIDADGVLRVKADLSTAQDTFLYEVYIRDQGITLQLRTDVTIQINVIKDAGSLIFTQVPYTRTVDEAFDVANTLLTARTQPSDNVVFGIDNNQYFNAPKYLALDSTTGAVTLKQSLLNDLSQEPSYVLRIFARRQFEATIQEIFTNVTINVIRNPNDPRFTTACSGSIPETMTQGSTVVQLTAEDDDTVDVPNLRFSLRQSGTNNNDYTLFYIDPISGEITLRQTLTSSNQVSYRFTAVVEDGRGKSAVTQCTVSVNRNLFSPQFINNPPYTTSIDFNQAQNVDFFFPEAVDNDRVGDIVYEIIGDFGEKAYFGIHTLSARAGVFVNSDLLSKAEATQYVIGLRAYDSAVPTDIATTNLTVNIDRNPSAPGFTRSVYAETVNEEDAFGTLVVQLEATDADGHMITYRNTSSNPADWNNWFYLDTQTGTIFIRTNLRNAPVDVYTITFSGDDNGIPSRSMSNVATVTIRIDRNTGCPRFVEPLFGFVGTVREDALVGEGVVTVTATDVDTVAPYNEMVFTWSADSDTAQFFELEQLDNSRAVIKTKTLLNVGSITTFKPFVHVTNPVDPDCGVYVAVTISVERNLYRPEFSQQVYTETIPETENVGEIVLTVNANDLDRISPNRDITFSMRNNGQANGLRYFAINSQGQISIISPIYEDSETVGEYRMIVTARDGGQQSLSDTADVVITIYRNRFRPVFQNTNQYSATIDFNRAAGLISSVVTATDADSDDWMPFKTLTYSIEGVLDSYRNIFSVNPTTGDLSLNSALVNPSEDSYRIQIRACDQGIPQLCQTAVFTLSLNFNVNDPRFLTQSCDRTLLEIQSTADVIQTIQVVDGDSGVYGEVDYILTPVTPGANNYFAVDNNGNMFVTRNLVNSGLDSYEFTLGLIDGGNRVSPTELTCTITITRNNFAPEFTNLPETLEITANTLTAITIYTAEASDQDSAATPFGQLVYSIVEDGPNPFSIDANNGEIRLVGQLPSTTDGDKISIIVKVEDKGIPAKYDISTLTLTVESNFNTPVIRSAQSKSVLEIFDVTQPLFEIVAEDPDLPPNNVQSYDIELSTEATRACFRISDNGMIYAKTALYIAPCNAQNQYSIIVRASDGGTPVKTSVGSENTLIIHRNDFAPIISNLPDESRIREDEVPRTVTTVLASDQDTREPFGNFSFSMWEPVGHNFFDIDAQSGAVSVNGAIANDRREVYNLQVQATDMGPIPKFDTETLTVVVARNLYAPEFNQTRYEFEVREDEAVGYVVGRIFAFDRDTKSPWNSFIMRVQSSLPNSDYFDLSSNGIITISRDLYLDLANTPTFTMSVVAIDMNGDTAGLSSQILATVEIRVIRNLQCPTFVNAPSSFNIDEQVLLQTLTTLSDYVQDNDAQNDIFGQHTYTLVGESDSIGLFSVNPSDGRISTTSELFRDSALSYILMVRVADGGPSSCGNTATMTVTVNRNLNDPEWVNTVIGTTDQYEVTINELTYLPSETFFSISATDFDSQEPHNDVVYSIGDHQFLALNPETGDVYLKRSIRGLTETAYQVPVFASDKGVPTARTIQGRLTVNVNRNRFPPEILNLYAEETIREDSPINSVTPVYRVEARDNDTITQFRQLTYSLIGDEEATTYFRIDQSGAIFLRSPLENDNRFNRLQVRVQVTDGGGLTDTNLLVIFIVRNLEVPFFGNSDRFYTVRVLENQDIGEGLVAVQAQDGDEEAPNNVLSYALDDSKNTQFVSNYFGVRTLTDTAVNRGSLYLIRSLENYPNNNNVFVIPVNILARDNGAPINTSPNSALVNVTVIRNTPPRFTGVDNNKEYQSGTIDMDLPAGGSIFQTLFTDANDPNDVPFRDLTFSITGDTVATEIFEINAQGLVVLKPNVNLATRPEINYNVNLRIEDGGGLYDIATLKVFVGKNLFRPVFDNNNADIERIIVESAPLGYSVVDLNATDDDLYVPNNQFEFSMEDQTFGSGHVGYFKLGRDDGVLLLNKRVDTVGAPDVFNLRVFVTDQGVPAKTNFINVRVIVDRVEGLLEFTQPEYFRNIDESTVVDTTLVNARATPGSVIEYRLVHSGLSGTFFDIQANGDIFVKTSLTLDPERERPQYNMTVVATRTELAVTQTASARVVITVNRNLHPPIFTEDLYFGTISEKDQLPIDNPLDIPVLANDEDGDVVKYRIVSGDSMDKFFLYPFTGQFSILGNLEGETRNTYELQIEASDQRTPAKTDVATVRITVLRDAFPPAFQNIPTTAGIIETRTDTDPAFFTIQARDPDLKGELVFQAVGDGIAQSIFRLTTVGNTSQVSIVPNSNLRVDLQDEYYLRVRVFDSIYPNTYDEDVLTIQVTRNPGAPSFIDLGNLNTEIWDTHPPGGFVLDANATDPENDALTYSITDASTQEFFYMDPTTGIITVKKSLQETTLVLFTASLRVCDDRGQFRQCGFATARITVKRNLQSPVFQRVPYLRSVERTALSGQLVINTEAIDTDLRGVMVYGKTGRLESSNSFFDIDANNGSVYLIKDIGQDGNYATQYLFEVIAYDSMYPEDVATSTVTIQVDRNPGRVRYENDQLNYLRSVDENIPVGRLIIDLNATDSDGDTVRYVKDQNWDIEDSETFFLDSTTGEIFLKRPLNQGPQQTNYVFQVRAEDTLPVGLRKSVVATVSVQVVFDTRPVFEQLSYSVTIPETLPVGANVYTEIEANDPDNFAGVLVYNVTGLLSSPYFFAANKDSTSNRAIVTLRNSLLGESTSNFTAMIQVYDSNYPDNKVSVPLYITVLRNLNNPRLLNTNPSITIFDYHDPREMLHFAEAVDADGDVIVFSMSGEGVPELFDIDWLEGGVWLMGNLRGNGTPVFRTSITVRDQRRPEKTGTGTLTINVKYDTYPPIFSEQINGFINRQISENIAVGSQILTVRATDQDITEDREGGIVYEMAGTGNGVGYFTLLDNGAIVTARSFNRSQRNIFSYNVTVMAYDFRYPENKAYVTVRIGVNRNEFDPVFEQVSYRFTIDETRLPGTIFGQVRASDRDILDKITYSLDDNSLFDISPTSGDLYVKGNVLADSPTAQYQLFVTASDNFMSPAKTTTIPVTIDVIRDSATIFVPSEPLRLSVVETRPINYTITNNINRLIARDTDLQDGNITFSVVMDYGLGSYYFGIQRFDSTSADVYVRNDLKTGFREMNTFRMLVEAYDAQRPRNKAYKEVYVTVLRNQGPPTWKFNTDVITMREDHPPYNEVITVSAEDTTDNDDISYEIVGETVNRALVSGASDYFLIDTQTGRIVLKTSVLNSDIDSFDLALRACDHGIPPQCITDDLRIVIQRDNFPPVLRQDPFVFNMAETEQPGYLVGIVVADDNSPIGQITYELVAPYPQFFAINGTTGELSLVKSLFFFRDLLYRFQVRVFDSGEPNYVGVGNIDVIVNRNPSGPLFELSPLTRTIHETHSPTEVVLVANATDIDGDVMLYTLVGDILDVQYFMVDALSGELRIRRSMIDPPTTRFEFQIQASDQRPVNEKRMLVNVVIDVDVDDAPQFTTGTFIPELRETNVAGDCIHTVSATDPDLKGTLVYELVGSPIAQYVFTLNTTTRQICLQQSIRGAGLDAIRSYDLRVIVYDDAYPMVRTEQQLIVRVQVNPGQPIWSEADSRYEFFINETAVPGSNVGTIIATDSDNDEITYRITATTDDATDYFFLVEESGEVKTRGSLVNAPLDRYTLTVSASDGRGNIVEGFVDITIIRNPDDQTPVFLLTDNDGNYRSNMLFNYDVGSRVTPQVKAIDNDLQGRLMYKLVGESVALEYFSVDEFTGDVSLIKDLREDIYNGLVYRLFINAYDGARPNNVASTTLFVFVTRNPNNPIYQPFTGREYSIWEFQEVGFVIDALTATDADNDTLVYFVKPGTATNGTDRFFSLRQTNGLLTVADNLVDSLPYGNTYEFTVVANDQGIPPKTGEVQVRITVMRDTFRPQFEVFERNVTINDQYTATQFVTSMSATDRNLEEEIQYVAVGDSNAMAYFRIEADSGIVYVNKDLKTTYDQFFTLNLEAFDTFFPDNRAIGRVNIFVERNYQNIFFENPLSYQTTVNEYQALFETIFSVNAVDPDGDGVSYSIISPPLAQEYFYVGSMTGDIVVKKNLFLNDVNNVYTFTIQATDSRRRFTQYAYANMTVNVVRNVPPQFLNLPTSEDVQETRNVGDSVFTVRANDVDLLPGSFVQYSIASVSNGPNFFIIDERSGDVTIATDLRRDDRLQYQILVRAVDSMIQSMPVYSTLTINMVRNAFPPKFTLGQYPVEMEWRDVPGSLLTVISANDPDGDNVTYGFAPSTPAFDRSFFLLNPVTGEVRLSNFVPPTQEQFILNVIAYDNANPEKTDQSSIVLTIDIDRANPAFGQNDYTFDTDETRPVGYVVGTVRATDGDLRGQIWYEINGEFPGDVFFDVNKTTGGIYIREDLTRDSLAAGSYIVYIDAYDSAVPDNKVTIRVLIRVARNQGYPIFDRAAYNEQVDEFHQLGVSVVNITATDPADNDEITYRIVDDTLLAQQYFYIDTKTGVIYLRRLLDNSNINSFNFKVIATDDGNPSRSNEADVTLTVIRVDLPTFNPPFNTIISENMATGRSVLQVNAQHPIINRNGNLRYELVGYSPAPYYFNVNFVTGEVTLNNTVRYDALNRYTLRVKVYDEATPARFSYQDYVVDISRNEYSPELTPSGPYSVTLYDNERKNTVVIQLNATDDDGDTLEYTLVGSQDCLDNFKITSSINNAGVLYLKRDLLATSGSTFVCDVRITDNGKPTENFILTTVTVTVIRVAPPSFNGGEVYRITLNENEAEGQQIQDLDAFKADTKGFIEYQMVGKYPASTFFSVNSTTGIVSLYRDLRMDSLRNMDYTVYVIAYDTARPNLQATATIFVDVVRNMNAPQMTDDETTAQPDENINTWGYAVNVTDPDSRNPTCSIIGNAKAQEYFRINPTTCLITIRKSLADDPDLTTRYAIQIQIDDNTSPNQFTTGFIYVNVPRDLFAPVINLPRDVVISESAAENSEVFDVDVTDADQRGTIIYRIIGERRDSSFFQISPDGQISLVYSPMADEREDDTYILRIEAYDSAWPSNRVEGVLTVNVMRNINTPFFLEQDYFITINADFPPGDTVLTVEAIDRDNDTLTYVSRAPPPIAEILYVRGDGAIILVEDMRAITQTQTYQFLVEAHDGRRTSPKFDTTTVNVEVNPLLGPPQFNERYVEVTIPINQAINSTFYQVRAVDPDLRGVVQYSLQGVPPGINYFGLRSSGEIYVTDSLVNTYRSYTLLISAYDSSLPEDTSLITVAIKITRNLNDPRFDNDQVRYFANIKDYDPRGTYVVDINATDADVTAPENRVEYSLAVGNIGTDYFKIDPNSGLITLSERVSMDQGRPDRYVLYVVASDRSFDPLAVRQVTATVTVSVDRNVAPTIRDRNSYVKTISEGISLDTVIFTIVGEDANPADSLNGQLVYSIPDFNASRKFQIDQSGQITPRVSLKDVNELGWQFDVLVSDRGIPSMSQTTSVVINIQKIGGPVFNPSRFTFNVDTNLDIGDLITRLRADDVTPDGPLVYEIRGDGLATQYFRLERTGDTAELRLNKSFLEDDNKTPYYTVRVHAYRVNDPNIYAEAIVIVHVKRNPNDPRFLHGDLVFNIDETIAVNTAFGDVNAEDDDLGSNGEIVYGIVGTEITPNYLKNFFSINEYNGNITVIGNLMDDPNTFTYVMKVSASDKGVPARKAFITVTINVQRNPNPPRFVNTPYRASVNENEQPGYEVIRVSAQDEDNDPIIYNITSNPPASLYFNINPNSGVITTKAILYDTTEPSYTITVYAYDNTAASRTSSIDVIVDIIRNPNPPVFTQREWTAAISEYADIGELITVVTATDADNPRSSSSILSYKIENIQPLGAQQFFSISPTVGEIKVARSLIQTTPVPLSVTMEVIAFDASHNPKTDTATVTVEIVRNRNTPIFTNGSTSYEVDAYERFNPGYVLINMPAIDPDRDVPLNADTPNAEVSYYLKGDSNSYKRFFEIRSNGDFVIKQILYLPTLEQNFVTVTVVATDNGWQPRSVEATVKVNILKFNDTIAALGFIQPVWVVNIPENEKQNTEVQVLDVVNQPDQSFVVCTILDGNQQATSGPLFSLEPDKFNKNCILILSGQLNYEMQTEYILRVRVDRSRTKRQASGNSIYNSWPESTIYVNVLDVNDNSPKWIIPEYPRQLDETRDKYFGLVTRNLIPDQFVLTISATDIDSKNYGLVKYDRGLQERDYPRPNPPFTLNFDDGSIKTRDEIKGDVRTWRFMVEAKDNPYETRDQNSIDAEVVIHLVEDFNRFVAVMPGLPENYIDKIEDIRKSIQDFTGYICLIERFEYKRVQTGPNEVAKDFTGTDIIFVLARPEVEPDFPLLNNTDKSIMNLYDGSLGIAIMDNINLVVEDVHPPLTGAQQRDTILTKSYIWWTDDPWAALVALTAISILLCFVGIIVLVFTHSRYTKYINNYRVYQSTYQSPEFVEPPNFLREYETQSLQMYVPPDETTNVHSELQLAPESISVVDASGRSATGAFNPVYVADEEHHVATTSYTQDTTLL